MRLIRRAFCTLAVAACLCVPPAVATSFSTDQSDLWYIHAESGWGMQLVQRGSVIFATLFVYGPDGSPTWYTATLAPTATPFQWSGDLVATTGPWFGTVPFNPANVTVAKVGTMTWTAQTVETGNVSYTVNGVAVSKNVIRQTLVLDDFNGHYVGGFHLDTSGCVAPTTHESASTFYFTQVGVALDVTSFAVGGSPAVGSCTYTGTLSEAGQMGAVQGSFGCTDGGAGTFSFDEVQVNISSISARVALSYSNPPGCQSTGWFGGVRLPTF